MHLIFCSIIGRSRPYSYSSWPLIIRKGSPNLSDFFFGANLLRTECIAQNLGIKRIIKHLYTWKMGRSSKTLVRMLSGTSQCQECVNVEIILADVSKMWGQKTFLNKICRVYFFKCLNSNDQCFHCPLQCRFWFSLNLYIVLLRYI